MADSLEREIQGLRALLHTDRDPEGRAFVPLADAYRRAGDLDRALEVVSIGLERHPTLASAFVVEARVQEDRGDANGAADAWGRVLELDAENIEALRGLGELLAAAGHAARAAPLLDKARALDPTGSDPGEVSATTPQDATGGEPEARRVVPPSPAPAVAAASPPAFAAASEALPSSIAAPPTASRTRPAPTVETPARGRPPIEKADFNEGEPEEPPSELPATRTLAELYARQGLHERAAQVYQKLLKDHPHDPALRQRLAELSAGGGHAASAHPAGVHDEDTEVLARALADRPEPVEPSVTPFAWGAEEAAPEPPPVAGHTVEAYFRSLLDWTSAREQAAAEGTIAEAAAGESGPVEAATVAADRVEAATVEARPVRAAVVEAPSFEAAPAVTQRVVPIESLAPGKVVPISALAPDVVPVTTLAPEAVPIETLAPRGPATSTSRS